MDIEVLNQRMSECAEVLAANMLAEGINDPYLFKAIFTAGGPGSGKSFVANHATKGIGMKMVNSDTAFETLLKKNKVSSKLSAPETDTGRKQQKLRMKAKGMTKSMQSMWIDGMLGLVVDGTGKDFNKIFRQAQKLREIGYDVGIIFVDTSLEVALARNKKRSRTVPEDMVRRMWEQVQGNKKNFERFFGSQNFKLVDQNETVAGAEMQALGMGLRKWGLKWAGRPLQNPIGKKKLEQLRSSGGKTLSDL